MSEPDWKVFGKPKPGRVPIAEPRIGIASVGVMTLNEKAFEVLGRPEAVELLFNEKEGLAALRPANPDLPTARRVWG